MAPQTSKKVMNARNAVLLAVTPVAPGATAVGATAVDTIAAGTTAVGPIAAGATAAGTIAAGATAVGGMTGGAGVGSSNSSSEESVSSGLRRSERLHAISSIAHALRDRGPRSLVVATSVACPAAAVTTAPRERFVLTPFGYRRLGAPSDAGATNTNQGSKNHPWGPLRTSGIRTGGGGLVALESNRASNSDMPRSPSPRLGFRPKGHVARKIPTKASASGSGKRIPSSVDLKRRKLASASASGRRISSSVHLRKREAARMRMERARALQDSAIRRPAAHLGVCKAHARLRRAELRVARVRRELLAAETDLNNIDFEHLDDIAHRAARRVTEGRRVAEDAYRVVHDQLGSDAPTLPDCVADDVDSEEEEEEDDDDDEGEVAECDYDWPSDSDPDDPMDLDAVVPPILVGSD